MQKQRKTTKQDSNNGLAIKQSRGPLVLLSLHTLELFADTETPSRWKTLNCTLTTST